LKLTCNWAPQEMLYLRTVIMYIVRDVPRLKLVVAITRRVKSKICTLVRV